MRSIREEQPQRISFLEKYVHVLVKHHITVKNINFDATFYVCSFLIIKAESYVFIVVSNVSYVPKDTVLLATLPIRCSYDV